MLEWMSDNVNIMLPMNLRPTDGYLNCPNNSDFWRVMVPTPATWVFIRPRWCRISSVNSITKQGQQKNNLRTYHFWANFFT